MSLKIGDITASDGMSKEIYQELKNQLEPQFKSMREEDIKTVREGWQKLAYAIAKGVIEHIQSNADVTGVRITVGSQVYPQTNKGKVE